MEKNSDIVPVFDRDKTHDYVKVLAAIKELPFAIGKKALSEFLYGKFTKQIKTNNLNALRSFASMNDYSLEEITRTIENLITNGFVQVVVSPVNRFRKTVQLTERGKKELFNPTHHEKKYNEKLSFEESTITEDDRKKFKELDIFLNGLNEKQKKAVVAKIPSKVLCVAGAGTGKTSVLTKRIEFLVKYCGVPKEKILAITFTRKARDQMLERLQKLGISTNIETFNSFSEKLLQQKGNLLYRRSVRVMTYGDKIMAIMNALHSQKLSMDQALDHYFTPVQQRNKTKEELSNLFMNDCFAALDYFKVKKEKVQDFSAYVEKDKFQAAKMVYHICSFLEKHTELHGLRDFTDQVIDTIKIFESNPEVIPKYDHVLVDEYQDVNAMQIALLDLLNPENLFCVGDPRQSIFGWRGSDINHILAFPKKHEGAEVITLTKKLSK